MKNLALIFAAFGFLWSAQSFASVAETVDLLNALSHRPGVHVVVDIKPSLIIRWTPYYRPAVEAVNRQSLSSDQPGQVEKLATYLNMPGNECTLKTLESLRDLLATKGDAFDAISKANYESGTPNPELPSLERMQRLTVQGQLYFVGYFDKSDNDLILFGCEPGTRGPDINGKLNCKKVRDDFDYFAFTYKNPLQDVMVSAPTLDSASALLGNSATTWNYLPHNAQHLKGTQWAFDGGGTVSDLMEGAYLDSLKATGQLTSPSSFEGRCQIGSGLLALLFGKDDSSIKAGYRIP